jgi:hypothetical protein
MMPLARGDVAENPYQTIIVRNPFGLRPAPTVDTNQAAPPPIGNLKFTGITVVKEVKKAYFMDASKNPPLFYALGEGEQQETLKVVKIDEKAGAADIVNAGIPTRVTFETHGNKAVVAGLAAPGPAMAGVGMKVPAPVPSGIPGAIPGSPPGIAPTSPPAVPGSAPVQVPYPGGATPTPGFGAAPVQDNIRMIPTRSTRVQAQPLPPQQSGMSAEASAALTLINKEIHREAVERKEMPPFPDPHPE